MVVYPPSSPLFAGLACAPSMLCWPTVTLLLRPCGEVRGAGGERRGERCAIDPRVLRARSKNIVDEAAAKLLLGFAYRIDEEEEQIARDVHISESDNGATTSVRRQ